MVVEILYNRTVLDESAMSDLYRKFHILDRESGQAYMKRIFNLSCPHPSYDGALVCVGGNILCEADDENTSGQPWERSRIPLAQHDCKQMLIGAVSRWMG